MSSQNRNPILDAALGFMDAAVPGMFDDPRAAWRAHVPGLRYVIIERSENLTIAQLKVIQSFSGVFQDCTAKNLLELRKLLSTSVVRLEPVPQQFAEVNLEVLKSAGIEAHVSELSEEEQREKLQILDELPPPA